MKRSSNLFALLGAVLLLAAVALSLLARNSGPQLLGNAREAEQQTEAFMDALQDGDGSALSALMVGSPALGLDREPETELASLLWEAYGSSISYSFDGGCYAGDDGLRRDVTVTALDIPALMHRLKERIPEALSKEVAQADPDKVYQDDGGYLDEFVMAVLCEEAAVLLKEGGDTADILLTLRLTCQEGTWRIHPDQALLNILSGGMGI